MSESDATVVLETFDEIIDELKKLNEAMEEQGEELKRLANLLKVLQSKEKNEYFSNEEYKDVNKIYNVLGNFCSENLKVQRLLRDKRAEIIRTMRRSGD